MKNDLLKMADLSKDPKVTVQKGSEACWLFVKVNEENWPAVAETDGTKKVNYSIDNGWTSLDGQSGVYYREVGAVSEDTDFNVITNNKVTVSQNLTKAEVNSISSQPKLTFTAYAVQREGFTTAAAAWAEASK